MNFEKQVRGLLIQHPIIETKRLILQLVRPGEADTVFHLRAGEGKGQFIGKHSPGNPGQAKEIIQESIEGKSFAWTARLKNDDRAGIIGTCGFYNIDYSARKAELGGEMATAHWGKYYAMEGTLALVSFGFNKLEFETIECVISPDNESASYLLEKLGFEPVKEIKDYPSFGGKMLDLVVYSRSKKS